MRTIEAEAQSFPTRGAFRIARGAVDSVELVVVTIREGRHRGRGECRPYARYGESAESVLAEIARAGEAIEAGADRAALLRLMAPGAARNAVDGALWDLEAKIARRAVHELAGLPAPRPLLTAYTLSLDAAPAMAEAARSAAAYPLLKLKLGGAGDAERLAAVRAARPDARLIADANEAWDEASLGPLLQAAAEARVELVEQPLPAGDDAALAHVGRRIPVCADEAAHTADGIAALADRYDAVNIKLDKTGGLTAALEAVRAARDNGFRVMAGCMVATSLAMAPALLIGGLADWVDLDGPLLLAADRPGGLVYDGAMVHPSRPELWG